MRRVYTDELPRYEEGRHKGSICWDRTIGMCVKFTYDDIEGKVEIVGYDKENQKLIIKYKDILYKIVVAVFVRCKLGILLGKITNEFKIEIKQSFTDDKRDLEIIDRTYKYDTTGYKRKYYKYKCKKCGFDGNTPYYDKKGKYQKEHWILESGLLNGQSCTCCCSAPKITVPTINSIYATNRWMVEQFGLDMEESKKFTSQSNKKIKVKCPYCGKVMYKNVNGIYNMQSIGCSCSDGQSYISKYVYFLLKQLNLEFQTEVKYGWNKYINPKNSKLSQASIDFVIYYKGREIPVEADGKLHRTDNHMSGQTKEQSEYIDRQRDENCLKYLGEETIRISDEGDIKENILNSKLAKEFDLTAIDWLKCEKFALKNLVKESCLLWNNGQSIKDISVIFGVSDATIRNYLNKGSKIGICSYDSKEEAKKIGSKNGKSLGKRIEMFDSSGNSLGVFESATELERQSLELFGIKLLQSGISLVFNGKRKQYKGFKFKCI